VPNVFTPNGDGINDLFKVKTQEKIFNFTIQIFNSFGLIVHKYQGNPADWQWDGSNNLNQQVPDGTYFWIAQFKDFKGKKKKETGCVMILR
ncbi:MAG: gliding motility-associated C-terminal domain-containing protein, partial [Bacteroidales bacterium]